MHMHVNKCKLNILITIYILKIIIDVKKIALSSLLILF
jgi:hypothetical protein